VSRCEKGETNLDFTGARDSEWQWNPLGHVQVCTSHQTDNHARTAPLIFYRPDALPAAQAAQPSVKALKANTYRDTEVYYQVRQKTDQVCNMTTAFTFITQLYLPELYDLIKVSHWGTYDKTVNMWLKMLQQLYAEIICRSKQQ